MFKFRKTSTKHAWESCAKIFGLFILACILFLSIIFIVSLFDKSFSPLFKAIFTHFIAMLLVCVVVIILVVSLQYLQVCIQLLCLYLLACLSFYLVG
ncbi:hypothetical protein BKH43_05475 [Helicobacter sp. 13S00401-1]|uniref:hypothetical protein n=1 Tax=Helicobacter sp. 13S00401-1 TaxID=1905758 RepID=UPI000BA6FAF2|nr:hypothetical protein [Helicobacter sp. 13S00401-1]PAF50189.1 hypothetical protein BKH43_05475 [Helicobacter sp. 13S00401-1]